MHCVHNVCMCGRNGGLRLLDETACRWLVCLQRMCVCVVAMVVCAFYVKQPAAGWCASFVLLGLSGLCDLSVRDCRVSVSLLCSLGCMMSCMCKCDVTYSIV